jgi:hypothetical protein
VINKLRAGRPGFDSQLTRTGSGAHPASHPMVIVSLFPRDKTARGVNPTNNLHLIKSCPTTRHEVAWGKRYSSYSFSTSALDVSEWSASRPGRALAPGKGPPVPIVQEAGWAPEPVWTQRLEEKSFRLCRGSNLDRTVVQPVARHHTD